MNVVVLSLFSFISTNIDDLILLVLLFTADKIPFQHALWGQYLGMICILLISWMGSALTLFFIPIHFFRYMGFLSVFNGLYRLYKLCTEDKKGSLKNKMNRASIFSIGFITIANGGDNIAVCVPLFLKQSREEIFIFVLIYMILTFIWCVLAFYISKKLKFEEKFGRCIKWLGPILWILIGIYIVVLLK